MGEVKNGLFIKILLWNNRLHDILLQISGNLIISHNLITLSGDKHHVHTNRHHGTFIVVILNGDLSFALKLEPRASSIFVHFSEASIEVG